MNKKQKLYTKILNDLYNLEDLTQYDNKKIGKSIDWLQKVELKELEE